MEVPKKKNTLSKTYVFYVDITYEDGTTATYGINADTNKEYYPSNCQALVTFFNTNDFWNFSTMTRRKFAGSLNAKSFDDYVYKYLSRLKTNITKKFKVTGRKDVVSYKVRFVRTNTKTCPFGVSSADIHNLINRKSYEGLARYYSTALLYSVSIYEKKAKEVEAS